MTQASQPPRGPEPALARLAHYAGDRISGVSAQDVLPADQARLGRRMLWLDGALSSVAESFVVNFMTPFALALGASNIQIGAMSAAQNLAAALALLPGARLEERTGRRKLIALLFGGVVGRMLLLFTVRGDHERA